MTLRVDLVNMYYSALREADILIGDNILWLKDGHPVGTRAADYVRMETPRTLQEAVAPFLGSEVAHDYFVAQAVPNGVTCAHDLASPAAGVSRPRLLDLFCCAGGAAEGYHRAGFEVVGVDIEPRPRYPFRFIQGDAVMTPDVFALLNFSAGPFAAIHASPPCQRFSDLAKRNGNADAWPDLIAPVRDLLASTGLPYVIENVEGAPLRNPVMLCGTMFPGLRVLRHRLFESNILLLAPPHGKHPLVFTRDKRKGHYGKLNDRTAFVQVTGGGNCSIAAARDAMGISWMTKDELNEAIPPAYTEHIGRLLLTAVGEQVAY